MERHGDETHLDTNEARSGSTPGIVRYVLIIGLVLAIGALTLIWVTGAYHAYKADLNSEGSADIAPRNP